MPAQSLTFQRPEGSGNLSDPGGLHHRGAALALREARSLILVGVNAAEPFPVGIVDADEVMVMFAAPIFVERSFASSRGFFRLTFCHVGHPILKKISTALSQGSERRTSTREDSNMHSITAETANRK